jgi:transcriptional regulator with XRE-family HTH domain
VRRTPTLNADDIRTLRGDRIRQARKQRGYSQDQLAYLVDVSRVTVSMWETGKAEPTTDNEIRLADALGVAWTTLFTVEGAA